MGKSKKPLLVAVGKKRKGVTAPASSSTETGGDSPSLGSPIGVRSAKSSRNGTIRHVYTTNSDMDCIEEYLKPVYKDGEVILEVECGSNKAMMYLSKLCQGSKGPCVEFQGSWLTPNEFQYVSGRETAKDWKRSIRHQGKSMKLLLTKGVLSVHSTVCDCEGCRLTSPVNRCRLAEKRRSVYSTNRKERLTIESFTSCDTSSLDGKADVADKTEEENVETETEKTKEISPVRKIPNKNCSPLRESRLSNIIEQLRSSKEKETSSEGHGFKKDFCEDEKRTWDENGNEGDADTDVEPANESVAVDDVSEPIQPVDDENTQENCPRVDYPSTPDDTPVDEENKVLTDLDSEDTGMGITEDSCEDITQTKEKEPIPVEEVKVEAEKREIEEEKQEETNTSEKAGEPVQEKCPVTEEAPLSTEQVKEKQDSQVKDVTEEAKQAAEITNTVLEKAENNIAPLISNGKTSEEAKPTKPSTVSAGRKERPEDKEGKSKHLLSKRSVPAAPTQDFPPSVSFPTALPASVPEQLFAGDIQGAKYSEFIRLLAASHLGSHIPLVSDRLIGDNTQGYPLASGFNSLPHPFPAYPFFPHHLPMKDTPPFQMQPLTMPPPFLPPYMYRPFGLLPHAFMDPGKHAHFSVSPEAFRPTPSDSASDIPRKRGATESDSALDLSTKRLKFDDRSVPTSVASRHQHRKTATQSTSWYNDHKANTIKHEKNRSSQVNHSRKDDNKSCELRGSDSKTDLNSDRKSNCRHECSCHTSKKDDIRSWSVTEVGRFLQTLDGCSVYADTFREHRVDGKSLPLLTVEHLMQNIGMKLGPAVLLTKTVAKRLKLAKQANRKCQICENKQSGIRGLLGNSLDGERVV